MEITGKLSKKLAIQKGASARGEWQKQEFVIEYQEGQYPSYICFNVWGDRVHDLEKYREGDEMKISFSISAREYNGRWYNDIRAWRLEHAGTQTAAPSPAAPSPAAPGIDDLSEPVSDEDDLPF